MCLYCLPALHVTPFLCVPPPPSHSCCGGAALYYAVLDTFGNAPPERDRCRVSQSQRLLPVTHQRSLQQWSRQDVFSPECEIVQECNPDVVSKQSDEKADANLHACFQQDASVRALFQVACLAWLEEARRWAPRLLLPSCGASDACV